MPLRYYLFSRSSWIQYSPAHRAFYIYLTRQILDEVIHILWEMFQSTSPFLLRNRRLLVPVVRIFARTWIFDSESSCHPLLWEEKFWTRLSKVLAQRWELFLRNWYQATMKITNSRSYFLTLWFEEEKLFEHQGALLCSSLRSECPQDKGLRECQYLHANTWLSDRCPHFQYSSSSSP